MRAVSADDTAQADRQRVAGAWSCRPLASAGRAFIGGLAGAAALGLLDQVGGLSVGQLARGTCRRGPDASLAQCVRRWRGLLRRPWLKRALASRLRLRSLACVARILPAAVWRRPWRSDSRRVCDGILRIRSGHDFMAEFPLRATGHPQCGERAGSGGKRPASLEGPIAYHGAMQLACQGSAAKETGECRFCIGVRCTR